MPYKQAGRLMQFSSTLGTDVLLIDTLEGVEGISRLFDFQAELYAEAGTEIDPSDLLGTKVAVEIALLDVQGSRYVNGIVASFEQTAGDTTFDVYRAHIVPSVWQLTLATNCRTFQGKTVMDVIKEVISPYALSVGDVTTFAYKPLDYCTQFNETDFNFISRLAEQFGIFYWFEHSDSDNKIVFGDSRDAYSECPDVSEIQYSPQFEDKETMYHSVVSDVRVTASMVTGKHSSAAWDYRPFEVGRLGAEASTHEYGKNALERYHFPSGEAGYVKEMSKQNGTPAHGARFVATQRDASDVGANVFHGSSTARSFLPGFTYDMTEHPRDAWNQSYLLTEIAHHVVQQPPYVGDGGSVRMPYTNRFVAIESERVYRPETRTQRPRMSGPQVAVVVTPDGEEQYIDAMGRINVRFMWDRTAGLHATDNTWVRVSQAWASRGFGTFFWPRLDDEVLVDFIDGDPDDPVIVGSLYNGNATPKYPLPDMSTRSGVVTRSTKGGTADNANELYFEDKKGSEEIHIHAEKDMNISVEASNSRSVGGDESIDVRGTRSVHVKKAQTTTLDDTNTTSVGSDSEYTVCGTHKQMNKGAVHNTYKDMLLEKTTGKYDLQVGAAFSQKISADLNVDAGGNIHLKSGGMLVIEAGGGLTIKNGGNFITINAMGIQMQGTLVMINSGGAALPGMPVVVTDPDLPKAQCAPSPPDTKLPY